MNMLDCRSERHLGELQISLLGSHRPSKAGVFVVQSIQSFLHGWMSRHVSVGRADDAMTHVFQDGRSS